jgi:hypothetical protein
VRGRAGHIGCWWFGLRLRSTIVSGLWVDFDEVNDSQSGGRESWGRVGRGKRSLLLAVAVVIGGDGDCRKMAVVLFLPQSWCFREDATVGRVHDLMDGRWVPVVVVVLKELVRDVYMPASQVLVAGQILSGDREQRTTKSVCAVHPVR